MNPDPKKAIVIPMGAKKLPPEFRKPESKKQAWVEHKSTFARDPWSDVVRMCKRDGILTPE